jgi:hypothetical protein
VDPGWDRIGDDRFDLFEGGTVHEHRGTPPGVAGELTTFISGGPSGVTVAGASTCFSLDPQNIRTGDLDLD